MHVEVLNDYRSRILQHTKKKQKPDKPRKNFPLSPANNGQWGKKIRGTIHYFGVSGSSAAAEAEYLRVREYLQVGRLPPATTATGIRMNDLWNRFLYAQPSAVESQELRIRFGQQFSRPSKRQCGCIAPRIIKSYLHKITDASNELLNELGLNRDRLGFYALRDRFETIAGGCEDTGKFAEGKLQDNFPSGRIAVS